LDREAELRLECLRIARQEGAQGSALIERAGELYAFCNGEAPTKAIKPILPPGDWVLHPITPVQPDPTDAAWDAVEAKLKAQQWTPEEQAVIKSRMPIAKAVGKDGTFDKPFSDYLKEE
jgi:hypothetical protein